MQGNRVRDEPTRPREANNRRRANSGGFRLSIGAKGVGDSRASLALDPLEMPWRQRHLQGLGKTVAARRARATILVGIALQALGEQRSRYTSVARLNLDRSRSTWIADDLPPRPTSGRPFRRVSLSQDQVGISMTVGGDVLLEHRTSEPATRQRYPRNQ
jgi:hypothetical protein